jgi:thiol-disulfide isomerase/thioredoxin
VRRLAPLWGLVFVAGCAGPEPGANKEIIASKVDVDDAAEVPAPPAESEQEAVEPQKEETAVKPRNKPPIYEERALTDTDVDGALTRAREENKHVLLMFGGNWCGWCHKLHELMEADATIETTLAEGYVLVMVDSHSNEELAKRFEIKLEGVPYLAVLDSKAEVLVRQETGSLEEGPRHDPKKVLAFLTQWRPKA